LLPESQGQIAGWFPIYDTMSGIRGALNIAVKMQFFGNLNQFREDSAGLRFFSSTAALACYKVVSLIVRGGE
jgi:hypothetical protein